MSCACSGAANTGLPSDQVARTLAKEGFGKMTRLAAMGKATLIMAAFGG